MKKAIIVKVKLRRLLQPTAQRATCVQQVTIVQMLLLIQCLVMMVSFLLKSKNEFVEILTGTMTCATRIYYLSKINCMLMTYVRLVHESHNGFSL